MARDAGFKLALGSAFTCGQRERGEPVLCMEYMEYICFSFLSLSVNSKL